jgi:chromosomal replication initiation ATPase DnaA
MKDMMALLDALDEFSKVEKRLVTLPLVRKMLADDEVLAGATS